MHDDIPDRRSKSPLDQAIAREGEELRESLLDQLAADLRRRPDCIRHLEPGDVRAFFCELVDLPIEDGPARKKGLELIKRRFGLEGATAWRMGLRPIQCRTKVPDGRPPSYPERLLARLIIKHPRWVEIAKARRVWDRVCLAASVDRKSQNSGANGKHAARRTRT